MKDASPVGRTGQQARRERMKSTEYREAQAVGLLTAARAVVSYASEIQRIHKFESPDAYTFQVAGYFVPEDKIDDLRISIRALEDMAKEAKKVLLKLGRDDQNLIKLERDDQAGS